MRVGIGPLMVACLPLAMPAVADDGCSEGTYITAEAPDRLSGTVLFSDFISRSDVALGIVVNSSVCSLTVPVVDDGYSVYGLDYRGFVSADTGQTATVIGPDGTTVIVVRGPTADDYNAETTLVGVGPGEDLDLSSELTVDAGTDFSDVEGTLDSIDYVRIGFTTVASVQGSMDQVAAQRGAVTPHLQSAADLLLGFLKPIDRPTQVEAVAAAGSYLIGADGAYSATPNLTLIGGVAAFQQTNADVSSSGILTAGAARYMYEAAPTFNVFGEAGFWGVPNLHLEFTRQYTNNGAAITALSETGGSLAMIYGRGGVVYNPNEISQFELSGTVGTSWLTTDAFAESANGNLFAATFPETTTQTQLLKATLSWTGEFAQDFDVTLSGALGQTFSADPVVANIAFAGPITSTLSGRAFVEYGARVGWQFSPNAKASAFLAGTTGDLIGTETRLGGMLSVAF